MTQHSNATFPKTSPVDHRHLGDFPITSPDEVNEAVRVAKKAALSWGQTPLSERLQYLDTLKEICVNEARRIAEKISLDTGKPLFESVTLEILTIPSAIDYYRNTAHNTLKRRKRRTPILFLGKASYVEYFPMGVIGIISPWNFPFQLTVLPIISALVAGNTVVLKPSEVTPITGDLVADLFKRAGFPEGVVTVLQGDKTTGAALVDAGVDKIFFTGSVATGRKVMASAAKTLTPVELELGGKDPFIVCADANLERAAAGAVWGAMVNCGQVCTSVERVFVHESVYDAFVKQVKREIATLTVGEPENNCDIGPMIFDRQIDIVERHLEDALSKGATILTGGIRMDKPGNWFEPTLVVDVRTDMLLYTEETFGPVLPIIKVSSDEEAIMLANDHIYGLTGSVWTQNIEKGTSIASRLHCGQASVNDVIQSVGNMVLPFGGVKQSGMGRYHGPEGLLSFVHTKALQVDRGWLSREIAWYPYTGKVDEMISVIQGLAKSLPKTVPSLVRVLKKST